MLRLSSWAKEARIAANQVHIKLSLSACHIIRRCLKYETIERLFTHKGHHKVVLVREIVVNPVQKKNQTAGLLLYSVLISLNFPDTHPTWLPTFTACHPLAAVAICSNTVPSGTAVMRP